jgi:hypothetical protein
MTKEHGIGRKLLMVDIAVEGHIHSKDEFRHAANHHSKARRSASRHRYLLGSLNESWR